MSELEEAWAVALSEAEARARAAGRADISEYLALRTSNDLLRKTGASWLLEIFESVVAEVNFDLAAKQLATIQITRHDAHRFKVGTATMMGTSLSLESGVRKLTVEVGWPRSPRDGFIRGGGLACGNITHLGIKSASEHLKLELGPTGGPQWIVQYKREKHPPLHEADIRSHVSLLLDEGRTQPKLS